MTENSPSLGSELAVVRDHSRQFSDFVYVYPVISRRSGGLSIGVNLNPDKVCNFDCVYCEVDRKNPGRASHVDISQMREELTSLIRLAREGGLDGVNRFSEVPALTREVRDIAFSGDGEPTLVDNFAECVRAVTEVRRMEGLAATKIVLITDAAGLDKADVKDGLRIMDENNGEIWAKLDAGTEDYFKLINRTPVAYQRILKNLRETARERPIVVQTLLLRIHGEAMPPHEQEEYVERLKETLSAGGRIKEVHLYTIARPTAEDFATPLSRAELEEFAARIRQATGLGVRTFA